MTIGTNTQALLRDLVARHERLEEEKKALADGQKEVMSEAKSAGLDPKIIRKVLALRKMDPQVRAEQRDLVDVYMHALGDAEEELA
jgi:uncharacterized protein (UPF0335 family)